MGNQDRTPQGAIQGVPSSSLTPTPAPVPTASPTVEQLLAAFMQQSAAQQAQIAELMKNQLDFNKAALKIAPRRKKSLAQRQAAGKTKFLPHIVYQNGREVNPSGLSQETINKLDTIATGSYCDGLVDVLRIADGPEGINSRIHIRYNNGTVEERMVFYMRFNTFTKLVNDIYAEMAERVASSKHPDESPFKPVIEKGREAPQFDLPEDL